MNEARNQFKGVYSANLLKAQAAGKQQEWHQAPKQIAFKVEDKPQNQKSNLDESQVRIQLMTSQLMKQGLSFKQEFDQSQKAIRGEIKEINKMSEDIKKIELKPDTDYWPDPFDNREEYLKNLKAEGKAVPMALGGAA